MLQGGKKFLMASRLPSGIIQKLLTSGLLPGWEGWQAMLHSIQEYKGCILEDLGQLLHFEVAEWTCTCSRKPEELVTCLAICALRHTATAVNENLEEHTLLDIIP